MHTSDLRPATSPAPSQNLNSSPSARFWRLYAATNSLIGVLEDAHIAATAADHAELELQLATAESIFAGIAGRLS